MVGLLLLLEVDDAWVIRQCRHRLLAPLQILVQEPEGVAIDGAGDFSPAFQVAGVTQPIVILKLAVHARADHEPDRILTCLAVECAFSSPLAAIHPQERLR